MGLRAQPDRHQHIREETYSKALAEIVNCHHQIQFAGHWGDGTTSHPTVTIPYRRSPCFAILAPLHVRTRLTLERASLARPTRALPAFRRVGVQPSTRLFAIRY
ncbi:MAG: Tn3 family transposase [Verrucomicrobia bacterium]|nr:Tn3 family transposase [Verrucomicrobiota bacterium]